MLMQLKAAGSKSNGFNANASERSELEGWLTGGVYGYQQVAHRTMEDLGGD